MGDQIFYMGPLGSAMATKLTTNMLAFIHDIAIAENLMLGARAGLDLQTLAEAIRASYGGSFVADVDVPMIFDGSYQPSFAIALACKDLRLAAAFAHELGVPMPVTELVAETFYRAEREYGGDVGCLQVVKLLEEETGIILRAG